MKISPVGITLSAISIAGVVVVVYGMANVRSSTPSFPEFEHDLHRERFRFATNLDLDLPDLAQLAETTRRQVSQAVGLPAKHGYDGARLPVYLCLDKEEVFAVERASNVIAPIEPWRQHWLLAGGYYVGVP
ncbi:MAG: hypothetical protein ACYTGV_11070, partial [Planctomycetota bacterium]